MFVKRGEGENAIFILFFIISSCFLKNMPFFRLKYPFIVLLMLRYVECYISIKMVCSSSLYSAFISVFACFFDVFRRVVYKSKSKNICKVRLRAYVYFVGII